MGNSTRGEKVKRTVFVFAQMESKTNKIPLCCPAVIFPSRAEAWKA